MFPDPGRPDEVARVTATGRLAPSDVDSASYAAIARRHSYRMPFLDRMVSDAQRDELLAVHTDGVGTHSIHGLAEAATLAALLEHAGLVHRQDRAYQRELATWTNTERGYGPGGGLPRPRLTYDTLPWAGLVRASTSLPDPNTLTDRLHREWLLLVHTNDDGPADHLRAGQAVQRIWLAATHAGLTGSILTQPLQVPEVRAGLIEQLDLPGFPQVLMRLDYPARPALPSHRMPISDLMR